MLLVRDISTVCQHENKEVCFHGMCAILRTFQNGNYLIENNCGFVQIIEPEMVNEVKN
jgi:hypothetical protein